MAPVKTEGRLPPAGRELHPSLRSEGKDRSPSWFPKRAGSRGIGVWGPQNDSEALGPGRKFNDP